MSGQKSQIFPTPHVLAS